MSLFEKQTKTENDFYRAALRLDAGDILHHTEDMIAAAAVRHERYNRSRVKLAGRFANA